MIELFECPPYLMFEHRSICSRILELYNVDNNLDIKYYIYNELSQKKYCQQNSSCSALFYSTLSNSFLIHFIQLNSTQFSSIQFNPIQFN